MTPEQFAELDRLFLTAVDLPRADRDAFVERLASGSPELARHLADMLRADEQPDPSIEAAVSSAASDLTDSTAPLVGERFGPYRADRLLGRGGMGAVFLGTRVDGEFEQTVAIKTVRHGLDARHLVERFRREREILARLEHPGIARLLDGGTGPHGLPFVAMEYVDGVPITEFVRSRGCALRRRLELFVDLCDAVTFVHGHSIVHRDIKPSNVLVTPDGRCKLLDFGIAKLSQALDAESQTRTEHRALTPDYASPEQILNRPMTTVSDVYSLGVVLYELLVDARPFRMDASDPYAVSRIITDVTPVPPSVTAPGDLPWRRRLRGDLDLIVMMALRKEPERRYASAAALADDVRRYLDGRPVSARRDVWHYRARRFVGRHPVTSAVAAMLLLTALGFAGVSQVQRRRMSAERDRAVSAEARAKATADFLSRLLMTADPREPGNRNMTVMDVVVAGEKELERASELDPATRIELHMVLGFALTNLEQFEPGVRSMRQALALSTGRYGADSLETAEIEHRLGDVYRRMARYDEAHQLLSDALDKRLRHIEGPSDDIADSYNNLAILAVAMGRFHEADQMQTKSLDMDIALVGPDDPRVGTPMNNLALLRRRQGRFEESLELSRHAQAVMQRSTDRDTELYCRLTSDRTLISMGRLDEAARELREIRPAMVAVMGPEHSRVLLIDLTLADVERLRGRYDEADAALASIEARIRSGPGTESTGYAQWLRCAGRLDRDRGRLDRAEIRLTQGLALHDRLQKVTHFAHPGFAVDLARTLDDLGRAGESETLLRDTLTRLPQFEEYPYLGRAEVLTELARAERKLGRLDEAADALDESRRIVDATCGKDSLPAARVLLEHGALALARGETARARALLDEARTMLADRLPEYHPDRRRLRRMLGEPGA
jgi:eukaryotic-like serine/threonine-protein kinase